MNISETFKTKNWQEATLDYIQDSLKKKENNYQIHIWNNINKELSPLTLYKYLKARFGFPKGMMMMTKNRGTTENLIHWHYHILSGKSEIHFIGKSSGLEICIKIEKDMKFDIDNWNILTENLISSYSKEGTKMNSIQNDFEHYTLFINPFTRLDHNLRELKNELKSLDISEPKINLTPNLTYDERNQYWKLLEQWIANIEKAVSLGSTIRMLCPVLAESFINILILMLRKDEFVNDKRLYADFLRKQIDVRVKSLHLNCNHFVKPIDSSNQIFKDFHTLMNGRNDFLHGNIDPISLMFEDVYFDMGDIPLFKEDNGIISKTMNNYLKNVEPETALRDYTTTMKFIAFVLDHIDPKVADSLCYVMSTRMPAVNRKTSRLAVLFPQLLTEGYVH